MSASQLSAVGASVLLLLGMGAAMAPDLGEGLSVSLADLNAVAEKNIVRFQLVAYSADALEAMAQDALAGKPVTLEGGGGRVYEVALSISPVFSPEYLESVPGVHPFAGALVDVPGSSVRLTVDLGRGTLEGRIVAPEGARYVEAVHRQGPLHVLYSEEDVIVQPIAEDEQDFVPQPYVPAPVPSNREVAASQGQVLPAELPGLNTHNLAVIRLYRDTTAFDPTGTMNVIDDVYIAEVDIKFYILALSTLNTNSWPDPDCDSTPAFLTDFMNAAPLNNNDAAQLYTDNPSNINYGNLLGCAYLPGSWSWARWSTNALQRQLVGAHEVGHNFNAQHDTSQINGRWTIMHAPLDLPNTDLTFSTNSRNVIDPYGDNMPREVQIWTGSEVSSDGVRLTYWYIHYPKSPDLNAKFSLKRTWSANSGSITLTQSFVAARDPTNGNRDFGYLGQQTLTTLGTTNQWTYFLPEVGGWWNFWPAYQYNGHWGPSPWQPIYVWAPS